MQPELKDSFENFRQFPFIKTTVQNLHGANALKALNSFRPSDQI